MAIGAVLYPLSPSHMPDQACYTEGKLLIVSEEAPVRRALHGTLFHLGYDIGEAASAEEALALCRIVRYDAILVDLTSDHASVPGKSGIGIYASLRRLLPQVAILMLGAIDDREGKIEALEAGADAWLTKPFQVRELTARLHSLMRPTLPPEPHAPQGIVVGEISLDPARRLVQKAGCRIHLTPKEFDLLQCLMTRPGVPVTHAGLINTLWGEEYGTQMDGLRTLVRQLRRKLEDDPAAPRYVLTECRFGYRFADPEDWLQGEKIPRRPGDIPH